MAEIVKLADFKKRKLAKAEADFYYYMDRAAALQAAGKNEFAHRMLDKATAIRKVIDALRDPVRSPARTRAPFLARQADMPMVSLTFTGLSRADLGWPKEPPPDSA